jgi:hypothetical protein
METWKHKYIDMRHGNMDKWRNRDMKTLRHGDMETWRHGDMENGDMETWRHGDKDMETWSWRLHSAQETWS